MPSAQERKVARATGWKVKVSENGRGRFEVDFIHDIAVHPHYRDEPGTVLTRLGEVYGRDFTFPGNYRIEQYGLIVYNLGGKDLRLLCINLDSEVVKAIILNRLNRETSVWRLVDRCIQDIYEREKLQKAIRETEELKRYLTEEWPPKLPSGAGEVRGILGSLRRFFPIGEWGLTYGDLSSALTAAAAACIAHLALEAAKYAESEARYQYLEWYAYVQDLRRRLEAPGKLK
jgi:hypothetical protein